MVNNFFFFNFFGSNAKIADFHHLKAFVIKLAISWCTFARFRSHDSEQRERRTSLKGTMQWPVVMSTRVGTTQLIRGRC